MQTRQLLWILPVKGALLFQSFSLMFGGPNLKLHGPLQNFAKNSFMSSTNKGFKNKMKPTNPNADTNVEKQSVNTCLLQFPANPLVGHPDVTH